MFCSENDTEIKKIFKLYAEVNRRYIGKSFYQMKEIGLHPGQIPILALMHSRDGCSQKEIAEELKISPSTVNVSIQRLEKAGIVCRKKDTNDQRIMRVYVTEAGKMKIDKALERTNENEEIMFQGFSDTELCLMRRFFEQIIQNMDKMPGEMEEGFDFFKKGEMEA